MKKFVFISDQSKGFNQRGQAVTEYLLILVVTIALILALSAIIIKPFSSFLENYMGAYLECLLDAGELPSLGYEVGNSICNEQFRPFEPGTGRARIAGAGGENDPNSSANRSKSKNSSGDRDSNASSGGGGSSRGSNSRFRGFEREAQKGVEGSGAASSEESSDSNLKKGKTYRSFVGRSQSDFSKRTVASGFGGLIRYEQEKIKKREQKVKTISLNEEQQGNAAKKKTVLPKTQRKAAAEEPEKPWDFSMYLKYFVLIAIILAIIFFVGSQMRQVFKGLQ
jgi:hypothetical protein